MFYIFPLKGKDLCLPSKCRQFAEKFIYLKKEEKTKKHFGVSSKKFPFNFVAMLVLLIYHLKCVSAHSTLPSLSSLPLLWIADPIQSIGPSLSLLLARPPFCLFPSHSCMQTLNNPFKVKERKCGIVGTWNVFWKAQTVCYTTLKSLQTLTKEIVTSQTHMISLKCEQNWNVSCSFKAQEQRTKFRCPSHSWSSLKTENENPRK